MSCVLQGQSEAAHEIPAEAPSGSTAVHLTCRTKATSSMPAETAEAPRVTTPAADEGLPARQAGIAWDNATQHPWSVFDPVYNVQAIDSINIDARFLISCPCIHESTTSNTLSHSTFTVDLVARVSLHTLCGIFWVRGQSTHHAHMPCRCTSCPFLVLLLFPDSKTQHMA